MKAMLQMLMGAVVLAVVIGLLFAYPVLWLWNGCVAPLGVPELSGVMHAWGLLILSGLLFKSVETPRQ